MAISIRDSQMAHIKWIDLNQDGIMVECAVLKEDEQGNVTFFEVAPLDGIDKQRLIRVINNRNSGNLALWDLMSQITLNNGVNALEYFHQLVKVITTDGVIYSPKSGRIGTGSIDTNSVSETASIADATTKNTRKKPAAKK